MKFILFTAIACASVLSVITNALQFDPPLSSIIRFYEQDNCLAFADTHDMKMLYCNMDWPRQCINGRFKSYRIMPMTQSTKDRRGRFDTLWIKKNSPECEFGPEARLADIVISGPADPKLASAGCHRINSLGNVTENDQLTATCFWGVNTGRGNWGNGPP